ncbi:hypothetical protein N657DRAFT_651053 [Parathielavia appendiculata]|uniref:Uncharacterized protein n=1 Tax=Parathielavia appendiculata TaxID=2587402 RepID=A0AAN6YYT5_9PEZI|nr:hypothetical protein N657DRAFT_651053 [Parathielavia appendiculata]
MVGAPFSRFWVQTCFLLSEVSRSRTFSTITTSSPNKRAEAEVGDARGFLACCVNLGVVVVGRKQRCFRYRVGGSCD